MEKNMEIVEAKLLALLGPPPVPEVRQTVPASLDRVSASKPLEIIKKV